VGAAVLIGKGSTVGGFVTPKHLHISRYFVGGVCHPEAKKQHESGEFDTRRTLNRAFCMGPVSTAEGASPVLPFCPKTAGNQNDEIPTQTRR